MALARLASIPLEIQFLASKELDPFDLLALSHASKYWRAFVLSDKRWGKWCNLIVSSSGISLEECLESLNVLDMFSKRTLVYVCLLDACTLCSSYAPQIFLPSMKRVCDTCLPRDKFSVMPLSGALAKYDVKERDLPSMLIFEWIDPQRTSKRPVKLVSEARIKKIASQRYGSEEALTSHLAWKKIAAKSAYSMRSADYREAVHTRAALEERGNLDAAAAVVLATTGRKIPKAFPAYPPILAAATRTVDRHVLCFEPRDLLVVGSEIVVDASAGDSSDSESDSE